MASSFLARWGAESMAASTDVNCALMIVPLEALAGHIACGDWACTDIVNARQASIRNPKMMHLLALPRRNFFTLIQFYRLTHEGRENLAKKFATRCRKSLIKNKPFW